MNTKGVEDVISEMVRFAYVPIGATFRVGTHGTVDFVKVDEDHATAKGFRYRVELSAGCRFSPSMPSPTFSHQLAMHLTRNGADAPHMQAEINRFLCDGKWQTTQSRNQKEK